MAILSTFLAVPVLMSGGAEGSGDILAASMMLPDTESSSTSVAESTSSSLFEGSDSGDLFQSGASVAVPLGESAQNEQAESDSSSTAGSVPGSEPHDPSGSNGGVAPSVTSVPVTVAPTTAAPSTVRPATTVTPTTAAPTTAAPTTAAPPTTAVPTTAAPTTAVPTTAPPATTAPAGPTAEQWSQLRFCESSGNYSVVNSTGRYYGAYQFGIPTWDGLASTIGRSDLVGVRPNVASPADQDLMALELWTRRGPSPWPVCGRYLPPKP